MSSRSNKTRVLVECGMLIAIAAVLSVFPKFESFWPNGGSITLCSMLPIVLISYRHGLKWGLLSGLVFSIIQILSGLRGLAGMDFLSTVGVIFLDYVVAYTVLGFGGIFRNRFQSTAAGLATGTLFALALRYLTHIFSGYILFSSYAEWFLGQENFAFGNWVLANTSGSLLYLLYSVIYNGSYMVPEMIITTIGAVILSPLAKMQLPENTKSAAR